MERGNFQEGRVTHCKVCGHSVVTCAKTAEPIEMLFGLCARTGPRNQELDGGLCRNDWTNRFAVWVYGLGVGRRKHKFNRIRQVAPMYPTTLCRELCTRLNQSICHISCGLWCSEGSTSSIVFAMWHQYTRRHCRKLCKNGWTDRFALWVVDSGGPKEAQVQLYSTGGAIVPTWEGTLSPAGEYDWTVHLRRQCGLMSDYFDRWLWQATDEYIGWQWRNFCISAVFRHIVGQALQNVCCSDVSRRHFLNKMAIVRTFSQTNWFNFIPITRQIFTI